MSERNEDNFLTSEQRRFLRLEVSLPIWIAIETEWNERGREAWTLGYTRDLSIGGVKIIVPRGEQFKWRDAAAGSSTLVLRFGEDRALDHDEHLAGQIRRADFEPESGHLWLGVEYAPGSHQARKSAMKLGLRTARSRRKWQGAFAAALALVVLATFAIWKLQGEVRARESRIFALQNRIKQERRLLSNIVRPGLMSTRAQGIDAAFQTRAIQNRIKDLQRNMARLSNPKNANAGESEREKNRRDDGLNVSSAPATGAQVTLGIALPYGYAWPQVTSDLEELIGRRIPSVVIFRDFSSGFPVGDCREARLRAKTLQITWEPWEYSDPKAITLEDIIAGKHDKYIDGWAQASKSFGNELWIRWGHEFNGNWYPWSIAANGRNGRLYAAAFRHVHSRFTRVGALNVKWIWCFNAESVPDASWNDPAQAYPGDDYVDMISIDGYNFGNSLSHSRWQSFSDVFDEPYRKAVTTWKHKPLMVGETSCATTGGDKAAWISEMDATLKKRFPKFASVVWFEAQKEADWRMASSPSTRVASRALWNQNYYRRGEP
jgi:beta-mannanase